MKTHRLASICMCFGVPVVMSCATPPERSPGVMRVVAIGDSITRGDAYGNATLDHKNTIDGGWVTRLRQRLEAGAPGRYEIFNQGINGDTALGVLARLESDVLAYEPDVVLLGIGTNDAYGDVIPQTPFNASASPTPAAYREALNTVLRRVRRSAPEAKVVLLGMATPLKRYWEMSFWGFTISLPEQAILQQRWDAYNEVLRESAREHGGVYVDVPGAWPTDEEGSWALYADGIHPNDAGYDLLADLVERALAATL